MLQRGLMMDRPLLISAIIEHAAAQFGDTHHRLARDAWSDFPLHLCRMRRARPALGERAARTSAWMPATSVASIAWNNHRHLEAYYAVSGSGMVMHTCNPRLHPEQLIYIINHAEDRALLFDALLRLPDRTHRRRAARPSSAWVCLSDAASTCPPLELDARYALLRGIARRARRARFEWPEFDERTGRRTLLHLGHDRESQRRPCFRTAPWCSNAIDHLHARDAVGISPKESILPIVPMFHVNGWCIPYAALIGGAKLVLPGPRLDGASLHELMEAEAVTVSAGVPTVWLGAAAVPGTTRIAVLDPASAVVSGGSAVPRVVDRQRSAEGYGIEVRQGWGMTETVAVATFGLPERGSRCGFRPRRAARRSSPSRENRCSAWK